MTYLLGVDVSHFQGNVDWNAVRRDGVDFAFAKATEGSTFIDPKFKANMTGMRQADIVPGAYHFLTAGNAAAQADLFCRTAPDDVIHALDVEAKHLDVTAWVVRYRAHFPHKELLIYTGRDLWAQAGGGTGSAFGPLWVAGYVANRYLGAGSLKTVAAAIGPHRGSCPFAGWEQPTFLQFTDKASVPGIASGVDGDVFYGTKAQLVALTDVEPTIGKDLDMPEPLKLTTQYQVDTYNANLPEGDTRRKKLGDEISAVEVQYWGDLGALRSYTRLQTLVEQNKALSTQLAALTAAVAALAAGSPAEVKAAFDAGISELETQLADLRITISTGQ